MKRKEAKELLPVITHFTNGGNLWCCIRGVWQQQIEILINPVFPANIIEDRHFEARKAYALGKKIEIKAYNNKWRECNHPTFTDLCKYRPKQQEPVFEWQWIDFNGEEKQYQISHIFMTEEEAENADWYIKLSISKRKRK